jgi:hypothetical protein
LAKRSERSAHPQFSSLQNVPSNHLHALFVKIKANRSSGNIKLVSTVQKTVIQHIFISSSPFSTILIIIFKVKISSK